MAVFEAVTQIDEQQGLRKLVLSLVCTLLKSIVLAV